MMCSELRRAKESVNRSYVQNQRAKRNTINTFNYVDNKNRTLI